MDRSLVVVGAAHVVTAALAKQLALALLETHAANGTVEHGFILCFLRFGI
jgi:hypothetical protein